MRLYHTNIIIKRFLPVQDLYGSSIGLPRTQLKHPSHIITLYT